jgi:hypothetical protein
LQREAMEKGFISRRQSCRANVRAATVVQKSLVLGLGPRTAGRQRLGPKLDPKGTEVPMTISTNGLVGLLVIIVLILAIIYFAKRV